MSEVTPELLDRMRGNIRALGILYFLSAGVLAIGALGILFIPYETDEWNLVARIVGSIPAAAFAAGFLVVGIGLRKLRPWAYKFGIFFACLGLLAIPIGTIIHGIILIVLIRSKPALIPTSGISAKP